MAVPSTAPEKSWLACFRTRTISIYMTIGWQIPRTWMVWSTVAAILRKTRRDLDELLPKMTRMMLIGGCLVLP